MASVTEVNGPGSLRDTSSTQLLCNQAQRQPCNFLSASPRMQVDVTSAPGTPSSSCSTPSTCRGLVSPSTRLALKSMTDARLVELMEPKTAKATATQAVSVPVCACTAAAQSVTPRAPSTPNTPTTALCLAAMNELLQRASTPAGKTAIVSIPGAISKLVSVIRGTNGAAGDHHTLKTAAALLWMLTINHEANQAIIGADYQAVAALVS